MESTIFLNFGICVIWWETHLFCPIAGRHETASQCGVENNSSAGVTLPSILNLHFLKALRMCWLPNHCLFSSEYPQNGKIYGLNWTFHLFSNMKGTIVFELPRSSHTNTRADFRFIQDRSIPCFAHITLIPMSTIVVTNRKKTSYKNTSKPLTESAPRKRFAWHSVVVALFIASARRRNRTTQSCTNCHISKRMVSLSLSYGLEVWLEGLMMSLTVW